MLHCTFAVCLFLFTWSHRSVPFYISQIRCFPFVTLVCHTLLLPTHPISSFSSSNQFPVLNEVIRSGGIAPNVFNHGTRCRWRCTASVEAQAAWTLWPRVRILLLNAWMFVSCVCCVSPWQRPLRGADKFDQRNPTTCVWSRNLSIEAAQARVWLLRHVN
jgi:hypothetical protein